MVTPMSKNPDIAHLINQARNGDRECLNRLALLVGKKVQPYLYQTTFNHDLSQDLLQDTLLAMICCLDNLQSSDRFWPWIYRIAWSKTQQHFRNQQRRPTVPFSALEKDTSFDPPQENNQNGLDRLIRQEELKKLSVALGQLKQQCRDIVQLRCFEQCSYSQISSQIQCNPQQARIGFFRAKQCLKDRLLPVGLR